MMSESEKNLDVVPLLGHDGGQEEAGMPERLGRPRARSPSRWTVVAVLLSYVPVILGTYLVSLWMHQPQQQLYLAKTFPALEQSGALKFEERVFETAIHNNPFAGEPRPELDAAWHDLFEDIRLKVSSEDLAFYNLTSVPFSDGSGYAAELGVHHELHCLKKIRHWIWSDYYLANETADTMVEYRAHIHHCLEFMREGIMCRGDTSLSTFEWIPGNPPRITAVAKGHHTCVNWDSMMGWVYANQYQVFDDGMLAAPESS